MTRFDELLAANWKDEVSIIRDREAESKAQSDFVVLVADIPLLGDNFDPVVRQVPVTNSGNRSAYSEAFEREHDSLVEEALSRVPEALTNMQEQGKRLPVPAGFERSITLIVRKIRPIDLHPENTREAVSLVARCNGREFCMGKFALCGGGLVAQKPVLPNITLEHPFEAFTRMLTQNQKLVASLLNRTLENLDVI